MHKSVFHWSVSRQSLVKPVKVCSSSKALHVQAEDGYHSDIDVSREIEGEIVIKLEQRHAII